MGNGNPNIFRSFECTLCGAKFDSNRPRPPCPAGCRLPIEKQTASLDLITTVAIDPLPIQSPEVPPAENDLSKRRGGRTGRRKGRKQQAKNAAPAPPASPADEKKSVDSGEFF